MTRKLSILLAALSVALFSNFAAADQIEVSYDIGASPGGLGGFSGSWVHSADGCPGRGPNSGETLFMCPDSDDGLLAGVEGVLTGIFDTDTGILSSISGMLQIFFDGTTTDVEITAGSLGGDFGAGSALNWFLEIDGLTFFFEDLGFVGPNRLSQDVLILWGQDILAYCLGGAEWLECEDFLVSASPTGIGIDLYGTATASVPEPGTLALLGFGLLGLGAARRLKRQQI